MSFIQNEPFHLQESCTTVVIVLNECQKMLTKLFLQLDTMLIAAYTVVEHQIRRFLRYLSTLPWWKGGLC